MELLIKYTQTPQVILAKSAVTFGDDRNVVSLMAEIENQSAFDAEGVSVAVTTKNDVVEILCEAEAIIGTLPAGERRVLSFKLTQGADSLYAIDIAVRADLPTRDNVEGMTSAS
jgi:hypothetical protein